jgi:DNA-directed RNA polymerase specialized sigma54-like protein
MKNTNDQYRQFLDEIESMIENEKRTFREIKESLKDSFSDKSIPELLKKRRRAYDHAFVECMNKYGFGNGNVRQMLDDIWDKNKIEQSEWKKYLRPFKVLNPFGVTRAAATYFDDTYKLKKKQWHSYLDDSLEIAKRIGKSND